MELALNDLSLDVFAEHVGTAFRIENGAAKPVEVVLAEATALAAKGAPRSGHREPFSLIFRPSDRRLHLPQQLYKLDHDKLGAIEIFLVPIEPDEKGMRFEAIFN